MSSRVGAIADDMRSVGGQTAQCVENPRPEAAGFAGLASNSPATTCADCKHWDFAPRAPKAPIMERLEGEEYQGREVWRQVGRGPVPGEWGTCERILRYGDDSHSRPPDLDDWTDDPAYLSDGSGYFASLTTRSDFGCTLYEEDDEEAAFSQSIQDAGIDQGGAE